jgi:UDP-N-acetylmuramate: L-alanyl-gamma-D-glutamyl-meso-diaminopimelate ligase
MKIHILGICGTFMGGLALLARELGHSVTGSDANVYPPMSTQLTDAGIKLRDGYHTNNIDTDVDVVIIGNALSRGNPEVEAALERGLRYTSGAQWLAENVLQDRWTIAIAGTHGKTTTSSMVAWILEEAGLQPGFLIGGVPMNFNCSARLGETPFFVIEADEYDTAFFDKRSKFVHYRPRTLVLNNLEFDHADIFDSLDDIKKQFHYLIRTVPGSGRIISNKSDRSLEEVLTRGCWSELESIIDASGWMASRQRNDCSMFSVRFNGEELGTVEWQLMGEHNMHNALAAIAASRHAGVTPDQAIEALADFKNVKRRLEVFYQRNDITIYDDFAHHPTEIAATLTALRSRVGDGKIVAVLEPRSNTMRMGIHQHVLSDALAGANKVIIYQSPDLEWDPTEVLRANEQVACLDSIDKIVENVAASSQTGDHIVIMSNGGFGNIHARLAAQLSV